MSAELKLAVTSSEKKQLESFKLALASSSGIDYVHSMGCSNTLYETYIL